MCCVSLARPVLAVYTAATVSLTVLKLLTGTVQGSPSPSLIMKREN